MSLVEERMCMIYQAKIAFIVTMLALTFGFRTAMSAKPPVSVSTTAKTLYTGTFHGKVHHTSGRATVYEESDGRLILRLTNFKTSNGPDVHVVLIAVKDASDDADFLKSGTERVELGKLKGNEGDQNYDIPAGTDLNKFRAVSIYCERFNANFGTAPLQKF